MKIRHLCVRLLFIGGAVAALATVNTRPASSPVFDTTSSVHERAFEITYAAEVHDIPADAKDIQIWLPYPQSDNYQKILKAKVTSPFSR